MFETGVILRKYRIHVAKIRKYHPTFNLGFFRSFSASIKPKVKKAKIHTIGVEIDFIIQPDFGSIMDVNFTNTVELMCSISYNFVPAININRF